MDSLETSSIILIDLGVFWDVDVAGDATTTGLSGWNISRPRISAVHICGPRPQCFAVLKEKSQK